MIDQTYTVILSTRNPHSGAVLKSRTVVVDAYTHAGARDVAVSESYEHIVSDYAEVTGVDGYVVVFRHSLFGWKVDS